MTTEQPALFPDDAPPRRPRVDPYAVVQAAPRTTDDREGRPSYHVTLTERQVVELVNLEMPDEVADTLRQMLDFGAATGLPRQFAWSGLEYLQHD